MAWEGGPWGDSNSYNSSGIAQDGTIDPLRRFVANIAHSMPGFTRESADALYRDMKKSGKFNDFGMKDGGVVRGVGCAARGHGKGKMV